MAKAQDKSNELVELNLGWSSRYVMPVDAATQIMALLVKAGAVRIDSEYVEGTQIYFRAKSDCHVKLLMDNYDPDIPVDGDERENYFAWIKTKKALIGDNYRVQSYSQYLAEKEDAL